MDLNAIKAKLNKLNDSNASRVDNSDKFWKVPEGETQIRIVPSKFNPADPFTELKFHTAICKYPILTLSTFGEQDPVEQLIEKLRETSDKENWSLSGKISPRPSYFVPVIVRGEEDKGVRIWRISMTVYKALLTLAADDEIGDFTDIVNGTDMVVTKTKPASPGAYPEITVRARRSSSPLSDDKNKIKTWLTDQPDPKTLYRHSEYDYVKKQLETYLKGGNLAGEATPVGEKKDTTETTQAKVEQPVKEPVKPVFKAKVVQTTASKFDDLFGDSEKTEETETEEDTLPF